MYVQTLFLWLPEKEEALQSNTVIALLRARARGVIADATVIKPRSVTISLLLSPHNYGAEM